MTPVERDFDSFTNFARQRIATGQTELSLDELFDLWRGENPATDSAQEDAIAIALSIDDFQNGDRGHPAGELSQSLRQTLEQNGE